jgi:Protein of unknown function (DUF2786)
VTEDNIIKKIQALLEMGKRGTNHDGSSNEAEALLAMQKAHELLAKYNLSLAQLEDANKESKAVAGGKRVKQKTTRSAMYKWQKDLWSTLCDVNYCWHWVQTVSEDRIRYGGVQTRQVKRHFILGREENVAAVIAMGDYLCDTIERLQPFGVAGRMSTSANSWREGCADRLMERLRRQEREEQAASEKAAANTTAITLVNVYDREYIANYDHLYGEGAYAKAKKRQEESNLVWKQAREQETAEEKARRQAENEKAWAKAERQRQREALKKDWSAYRAGQDAGNDINLGKQIKGGE